MDEPGTDSLRKLAPNWTLAGDEQLLSILQNTHQKLLSKCQEANSQLEQMATVLNDATISLQNVNNQFMALSSSQFIESRVYDDDDLSTDVQPVKDQPKPEIPDELTSLKRSISVLENAHEVITILQDSDTESDTDDEMPARMVLKPKDMYASRPLPYIIGTQSWKNKWHAGLLLEDSDSDSTASKVEHDSDQYSQSEPEDITDKLPVPHTHTHTTVSETSSELPSEQGSVPKPTPSDVASEIARRLGAGREPPKMVEREPEDEQPPIPTVRKIYRPQDPVSSTIFPDEPPPLTPVSDSGSDIFAELHRAQPYASANVPDELFADDRDSDDGDIFSDFAKKPATNPNVKPTSLFDSGPTPNMFVKHTDNRHTSDDHSRNIRDDHHKRNVYDDDDRGRNDGGGRDVYDEQSRGDVEAERVKKPIGGISLFGNKGTESIGAAILKRNQRKSSTSGDDSGSDSRSESHSNQQIRKEKDIFDDLFARSESKNVKKDKDFSKDLKTQIQKKTEVKEKKIEKPKVDLFSDNLFDDIDDIFTTNVVKMPSKDNSKSKSIFEDDDDLFSEIAAPKPMKIEVASSSNNKKGLFDSDDELFSETKPVEKPKEIAKPIEVIKPKAAQRTKINEGNKTKEITNSIFDDDEDELFSDTTSNKIQNNKPVSIEKPQDFGKEDTKNIAPTQSLGNNNVSRNVAPTISNVFKSASLFDDDDDESDLFAEPAKSNVQNVKAASIKHTKLSSKTDIYTPEENLDVKPSSKIEVNIPEKNVVIPSNSVKNDESDQIVDKNEKVDVNKDSSKPLVDKIVNTSETQKTLKDEENSSPVSQNVDSKIVNVETNAAKIFEHIHKNIQNVEESSSETNNDFSDQDFDDLPPNEDNNKTVTINNNETEEIPTEKPNIFDKTTLEEDIDELFTTAQQKTDNTEPIFKNIVPDYIETIPEKTEQDNKTAEIATKPIEADIFSNIITEPPVFEKPKEPKKSKNVNALFDDDSDDESLFFKKNDPIFVENPQEFTPTQDRIFGLFTDEPPDDGFSKISDEFDEDMFSTFPKPKLLRNEYPPIPDTVLFEDSTATGNIIPEIEKVDPRNDDIIPEVAKVDATEEMFNDSTKDDVKPASEIRKELKSEDIFKLLTTENVDERQKSPTVLSDDEQLFKKPTLEPKSALQGKPSLDFLSDEENLFAAGPSLEHSTSLSSTKEKEPILENKKPTLKDKPTLDLSDDENLFASGPKFEKPLAQENLIPENKKPTLKDKPTLDLSDDENLFASGPKFEKPLAQENLIPENKKPTLKDKPTLDLSDDENLFASGPKFEKPLAQENLIPENKKPTLKDKPTLDLSDDENLFASGPKFEKPLAQENLIPENKKPTLKDKPTLDLSDDENLFASGPKFEKPLAQENLIPENKKPTLKDKPTLDLSDDENLFASGPKFEKPLAQENLIPENKKPTLKDKPTLDLTDDENLFASGPKFEKPLAQENLIPENKKPTLKDKPTLDLSDDENLFASGPKFEKPLAQENLIPENKKPTLKDKPTLDLSDDENLFASGPKFEKPLAQENLIPENKKPTLKDKPTLDLSDDENLFASGPKFENPLAQENLIPENKKPTLKDKPTLDLSDDENLFASVPTLEKSSLPSSKPEKPIPENKNLTFKNKPSQDLSDDENLFGSGPALDKPEKPTLLTQERKLTSENKNLESISKSSDDELFTSLKTEKSKLSENKLLKQDSKSDEDLFKKPEFVPKSAEIASESKPEKSEKKVGKLKVGLNINVNALLPGASPKKVKPNDQPDGQSQSVVESQKSVPRINTEAPKSESRTENQNADSKLLKSVSFDGKPESDVLDNKLSKERAKIQVKRRPSTRRARREAVRKSGIDFGEDSTDNSSSIDDPPRKHPAVIKKEEKPIEIRQDTQSEIIDNSIVQAKLDNTTVQAEINCNVVEKQPTIEPAPLEKQPEITERPSYSRDKKTKVVYILNDEDIFNTSPLEKPESVNENLDSNTGVTTLGKVYDKTVESNSKKDSKSSLFGDENIEEIFKAKTVTKKSTIFDSDSEEELFGTSKREEKERKVEKKEVKKEIKREVVKGSLFGDEDDDDDLFGVKTKKIVDQKPQPSRSTAVKETKETPKPAEPVFEDPLSMFGDDD